MFNRLVVPGCVRSFTHCHIGIRQLGLTCYSLILVSVLVPQRTMLLHLHRDGDKRFCRLEALYLPAHIALMAKALAAFETYSQPSSSNRSAVKTIAAAKGFTKIVKLYPSLARSSAIMSNTLTSFTNCTALKGVTIQRKPRLCFDN